MVLPDEMPLDEVARLEGRIARGANWTGHDRGCDGRTDLDGRTRAPMATGFEVMSITRGIDAGRRRKACHRAGGETRALPCRFSRQRVMVLAHHAMLRARRDCG